MSVNALIAQGLRPIGADVPEVGNMLQQMRQREMQNALAQRDQSIQEQNAQAFQRQVGLQADQRQQQLTQQQYEYAARAGLALSQAKTPQEFEALKAQVLADPQYQAIPGAFTAEQMTPENVRATLPAVMAKAGMQMPQAPVPFEQTPEGIKLAEQRRQFEARLGFDNRKLAADERAAQQANAPGLGKPPPGYQWKPDGTLMAIPGGPADIKATAAAEKDRQRAQNAADSAGNVLEMVRSAITETDWTTTGLVGSGAAKIKGTPAYDLQQKLLTIKANLGFDRLQQMRESSPTGGALGQVAVQELNSLQASVASLDQGQSKGQLRANLQRIQKHYENWEKIMKRAGAAVPDGASGGGGWSAEEIK